MLIILYFDIFDLIQALEIIILSRLSLIHANLLFNNKSTKFLLHVSRHYFQIISFFSRISNR